MEKSIRFSQHRRALNAYRARPELGGGQEDTWWRVSSRYLLHRAPSFRNKSSIFAITLPFVCSAGGQHDCDQHSRCSLRAGAPSTSGFKIPLRKGKGSHNHPSNGNRCRKACHCEQSNSLAARRQGSLSMARFRGHPNHVDLHCLLHYHFDNFRREDARKMAW
jgi:hypothetical protein